MLNNLTLNSNENKTIYLFSIGLKIDLIIKRSHLILCFGMCEKTVMSNVFIMK